MTRLSASFPYVHGNIAAIALPPDANDSGACTAPASWKSGNVMAISRIVSVAELRTFVESNKPNYMVNTAMRVVVK
jgi:hypothetical protein